MQLIEQMEEAPPEAEGGVIAIGTFDGIHLGHQKVIEHAVALADAEGVTSLVFTFKGHPLSLLAPERAPRALISHAGRRRVLEDLGVDILVEEAFTPALASLTADEFLERLARALSPRAVVVGKNFSFGAGGLGTTDYLVERGRETGFRAEIAELLYYGGAPVSSTRIRRLLTEGDVRLAGVLLGRLFSVEGVVAHGEERGRTLGFPTANLTVPAWQICPADGAYVVRVTLPTGETRGGMESVGTNPTFGGVTRHLEVNIFDFSGDLYDARIDVRFVDRLRGEERFASAGSLVAQLREDERRARALLTESA